MLRNRQKYSGNKSKLFWGFFRTAFFGLWFTTLIKLQIIYLSSDAKDFVSWLFNNARSALGGGDQNSWLDNNSVSHFTTFLMMTVIIAIIGFCLAEISGAYDRSSQYNLARFTMIAIAFCFLLSAFCFLLSVLIYCWRVKQWAAQLLWPLLPLCLVALRLGQDLKI